MTKLIFLNAKINEITRAGGMKSEYRNVADVRVEEIVTSIDVTVDSKKNK